VVSVLPFYVLSMCETDGQPSSGDVDRQGGLLAHQCVLCCGHVDSDKAEAESQSREVSALLLTRVLRGLSNMVHYIVKMVHFRHSCCVWYLASQTRPGLRAPFSCPSGLPPPLPDISVYSKWSRMFRITLA
jgi:hypothetical protein